MISPARTWFHLDSLGLILFHLDSLDLTLFHLNSIDLTCTYSDSVGLTLFKGEGTHNLTRQKGNDLVTEVNRDRGNLRFD